jgi:hypothetical protein
MKVLKKIAALAIIGLATINSCKNDDHEPVVNTGVTAEKTDVQPLEIVSLVVDASLDEKYSGTFGSVAVDLHRTSDSTLTFFVPDIPKGKAALKFELATINFNVEAAPVVNTDQVMAGVIQRFDNNSSALQPSTPEEIEEVNALNEYKQEVMALFNSLSDVEKRQAIMFYEAN